MLGFFRPVVVPVLPNMISSNLSFLVKCNVSDEQKINWLCMSLIFSKLAISLRTSNFDTDRSVVLLLLDNFFTDLQEYVFKLG